VVRECQNAGVNSAVGSVTGGVTTGAIGFFDGVQEFPGRAGLVGWAGDVGGIDAVVEDGEGGGSTE
jgi:hypothetical protein